MRVPFTYISTRTTCPFTSPGLVKVLIVIWLAGAGKLALAVGDVMLTVGGLFVLDTTIVRAAEVACSPRPSVATAVSV
jgi:hypothetical protein